MKRWIHASSDLRDRGWLRDYSDESQYGYYIKQLDDIKAIIKAYDNANDWGYEALIYINDDLVDSRSFSEDFEAAEAKAWTDSLIREYLYGSEDAEKATLEIQASFDFDSWYDSLEDKQQDAVDSLADEIGLPPYDECSDAELAQLHDSFVSNNAFACTDIEVNEDVKYDDWLDDDRDTDDIFYEGLYERGFMEVEQSVLDELGLYADMSSVRGGQGRIFFYSDPNHENNADIWMGHDDYIDSLDYAEYESYIVSNIFTDDESRWKELYRKYIETIVHK